MVRIVVIVAICAFTLCTFSLYQIKYRVQNLKRDLSEIHRQLDENYQAIHVLNAEWAYLNHPERIATLAQNHLSLSYTQLANIQPEPSIQTARHISKTKAYAKVYPVFKPTNLHAR